MSRNAHKKQQQLPSGQRPPAAAPATFKTRFLVLYSPAKNKWQAEAANETAVLDVQTREELGEAFFRDKIVVMIENVWNRIDPAHRSPGLLAITAELPTPPEDVYFGLVLDAAREPWEAYLARILTLPSPPGSDAVVFHHDKYGTFSLRVSVLVGARVASTTDNANTDITSSEIIPAPFETHQWLGPPPVEARETAAATVEALIEALSDTEKTVRFRAARALGAMGVAAMPAVPVLTKVGERDTEAVVRFGARVALRALCRVGDELPEERQPPQANRLLAEDRAVIGQLAGDLGALAAVPDDLVGVGLGPLLSPISDLFHLFDLYQLSQESKIDKKDKSNLSTKDNKSGSIPDVTEPRPSPEPNTSELKPSGDRSSAASGASQEAENLLPEPARILAEEFSSYLAAAPEDARAGVLTAFVSRVLSKSLTHLGRQGSREGQVEKSPDPSSRVEGQSRSGSSAAAEEKPVPPPTTPEPRTAASPVSVVALLEKRASLDVIREHIQQVIAHPAAESVPVRLAEALNAWLRSQDPEDPKQQLPLQKKRAITEFVDLLVDASQCQLLRGGKHCCFEVEIDPSHPQGSFCVRSDGSKKSRRTRLSSLLDDGLFSFEEKKQQEENHPPDQGDWAKKQNARKLKNQTEKGKK